MYTLFIDSNYRSSSNYSLFYPSFLFIYFLNHAYHLDALRSFVEENEGVYDRQIYGVLETVAVLDPTVVQALIPNLSLSLRNTEHKRGLGKNIALR